MAIKELLQTVKKNQNAARLGVVIAGAVAMEVSPDPYTKVVGAVLSGSGMLIPAKDLIIRPAIGAGQKFLEAHFPLVKETDLDNR